MVTDDMPVSCGNLKAAMSEVVADVSGLDNRLSQVENELGGGTVPAR